MWQQPLSSNKVVTMEIKWDHWWDDITNCDTISTTIPKVSALVFVLACVSHLVFIEFRDHCLALINTHEQWNCLWSKCSAILFKKRIIQKDIANRSNYRLTFLDHCIMNIVVGESKIYSLTEVVKLNGFHAYGTYKRLNKKVAEVGP